VAMSRLPACRRSESAICRGVIQEYSARYPDNRIKILDHSSFGWRMRCAA